MNQGKPNMTSLHSTHFWDWPNNRQLDWQAADYSRDILNTSRDNSLVNQSTPSPVFDVRDVPCGGPGAVEPVAAGPEVAGEEAEDIAPATETDWAGVLAVVTDTPALGVV